LTSDLMTSKVAPYRQVVSIWSTIGSFVLRMSSSQDR